MLNRQSPHVLISVSALFCCAVVLLCVYLALHLPWLGFSIEYNSRDNHWQLTHIDQHSSNRRALDEQLQQQGLTLPLTVQGFQLGDKQLLLTEVLFIEEPDTLPTYAQFNQLMQDQQALFLASEKDELSLILYDGQGIPVQTTTRSLMSLPVLFWFQLFVGVGGALTGALVWASRRRDPAAILYALTGVGYLIFAPAAAIYSTREFIINGELFRILSALNHFGALFFTASLTSLLWTYPIRLGSAKVPVVIYTIAFVAWVLNVLQWIAPVFMHLAVLLIFSISFVFSAVQWQKTRKNPSARAALRWFLLSIYTATGLFAGFIIIPAALHIEQPASQGIMFGAFLLMYWGLALGIVKYRLFQLEQWWHSITGWFVSGLFIVVFDIVLVSGLALPQELALPIALAIAGWLYFPLRQFLWSRIGRQANSGINAWIGNVLPLLIDQKSDESFKSSSDRWEEILREVWHTPHVEQCAGQLKESVITNDGLSLSVPAYLDQLPYHFRIDLPDAGARLFTSADIKTVKHLQQMIGLALARIDARNQGMQVERDRIRRDMHDDLGATLLKLLHASSDDAKPLVRNAIADMRQLVTTLEQYPVDKGVALANWRQEAEERCKLAGAELHWSDEAEDLPELLSARTYTNLSRILREAISNALKYASTAVVKVDFNQNQITLINPIIAGKSAGHGSGLRIMRERAVEINAQLECREEESNYLISVSIPPEQG
jgi:signal transduction histidine kinase